MARSSFDDIVLGPVGAAAAPEAPPKEDEEDVPEEAPKDPTLVTEILADIAAESEAPLPEGWVLPASPSGWYRVLTPVDGFAGRRLGKTFIEGEVVVHNDEARVLVMPAGKRSRRLVDLFAEDLQYRVEAIPLGVPPVPRSTLAAAGMSAAVAGS
jgi:hypothetical protein